MENRQELLTVREQQFYAFLKTLQSPLPSQSEMARMYMVPRQRVHQLLSRLREKGYLRKKGGKVKEAK